MGWICQICSHPERLAIDRAILSGLSKAAIGRAFDVPAYSVQNHAERHLSRQLLKSNEMREMAEARNLAAEIDSLIQRTKRILDLSERDGLHLVSLKAISELRASFAFMVSTAFLLRQDEREEQRNEDRAEIETLRARLTRFELETLQTLLAKVDGDDSNGELLSARWSGKTLPYYDLRERPRHGVAEPAEEESKGEPEGELGDGFQPILFK